MTVEERRQTLIEFLQNNNILDNFSKNLSKEGVTKDTVTKIFEDDNPSMIMHAFVWDNSPEGHEFWQDFYRLWLSKFK